MEPAAAAGRGPWAKVAVSDAGVSDHGLRASQEGASTCRGVVTGGMRPRSLMGVDARLTKTGWLVLSFRREARSCHGKRQATAEARASRRQPLTSAALLTSEHYFLRALPYALPNLRRPPSLRLVTPVRTLREHLSGHISLQLTQTHWKCG